MSKKLSYEEVKEYIENEGYELLSKEYVKTIDKLILKCPKGHEFPMDLNHFKNRGQRCPVCEKENRKNPNRNHKNSFEEVKNNVESEGFKLLSNINDYLNNTSKLNLECLKGHKFTSSYSDFKSNKYKCPDCANEMRGRHLHISGDVVKEFVEKENYQLIKIDYENYRCYITLKCPNNHIWRTTWQNFKGNKNRKGNRCIYCFGTSQPSWEEVNNKFKEFDMILLEKEYINSGYLMAFICKHHPEQGIQYKRYSDLCESKGCKYCGYDRISKENSYLWKGGITSLNIYLRKKLYKWQKDSLIKSNYKCVLTGEIESIEIHHIYNFNKIVKETIEVLNLPIYEQVSQYSSIQLNDIKNKCLELHYKYGLGVCLTDKLHTLFHLQFGYLDNNLKQFLEFQQMLLNHKFDDYLKENNLVLNIDKLRKEVV